MLLKILFPVWQQVSNYFTTHGHHYIIQHTLFGNESTWLGFQTKIAWLGLGNESTLVVLGCKTTQV